MKLDLCLCFLLSLFSGLIESIDHAESSEDCGCSSGILNRNGDEKRKLGEFTQSLGKQTNLIVNNGNMVLIPSGSKIVGSNDPILMRDGEGPRRGVLLSSFYIDPYEIPNAGFFPNLNLFISNRLLDFAKFVEQTGFVTESERFGWSFVFVSAIPNKTLEKIEQAVLGAEWWLPVNHSFWREPEGPGTDVFETNRSDHPVVQVSWNDAKAYCEWRGARLPTEAEWEAAARGPNQQSERDDWIYPWSNDQLVPNKTHRANVFQGKFPHKNDPRDGYRFTAPITAYGPQNEYGLYNMIGNVWEWVEDWHTIYHDLEDLVDPRGPSSGTEKVKKGGSFLCHRSYCFRYRIIARFPSTPDSATSNIGFRCARSVTSVHDGDDSTRGDEL